MMASDQTDSSNACIDERVFAEDLPSTSFSVYPTGEQSAFHTQNDPSQPFQRDKVIERRDRVLVLCEHKDIIHGYHSDENRDPHSLIVLGFRFSPNGLARRIREASVVIKFAAMRRGEPDPEVEAIHPDGNLRLEPTQQHVKVVRGGGVSLTGGVTGADIGAELRTEKTIESEVSDATTVEGAKGVRDRNWGKDNSASWTLWENATTETGVITSMQTAILLKRGDMELFKSTVKITIKADAWTEVMCSFKSNPKDDDVWYDPHRKPTNRLRRYDAERLGMLNLESVCDVTYQTILGGTTKQ